MRSSESDLLRSAHAYQRAIVRLCLNDNEDGCRAGSADPSPRAWLTYRRLVRARLRETVEHAFERLHARLGPETFCELLRSFLHARGPREIVLRHVPREFLRFLEAQDGEHCGLPPWAVDLARFEWMELEVAYTPDDDPSMPVAPLSMDRPLALSSACRMLQVDYRVHELLRDHPLEPIRSGRTWICVYRDRATFDVRVLELSESAAALLEEALSGVRSLADCAKVAARQTGATVDAGWLEAFATLLSNWTERGIVLGSRPADSQPPPAVHPLRGRAGEEP